MRAFLISYDLGIPETSADYDRIKKFIEAFSDWCKPLKSQWIVLSNKSARDIRTEMNNITDNNDGILVIDITGDAWASQGLPTAVTNWLKEKL